VSAVLIFPGGRRGKLTVTLGGDLATFLHAAGQALANSAPNAETAARPFRAAVAIQVASP
jgi:hypothetical protein